MVAQPYHTTFCFSSDALPQLTGLLPSAVATPSGVSPRQAARPWTKDFSFYEEYKLRRNELRHRNLNRRRELEKTLPQPLLADLVSQMPEAEMLNTSQKWSDFNDHVVFKVRERREKTRLRVARWRAKRKLQACLTQSQVNDHSFSAHRWLETGSIGGPCQKG